jgi:hypothetical protein
MSPSAVRAVHAVLAGAFKQAKVWGWIDHNPEGVGHPSGCEANRRP